MDLMLKKLFEKRYSLLKQDSKFTDSWLKKTWIKILDPTDINDFAAYEIAYLFIDDADFLEPSRIDKARAGNFIVIGQK